MTPAGLPIVARSVDDLIAALVAGAEHADEPSVNQLEHALQCAACLADRYAEDVELQVAGLLHDVGHVLAPGDDVGHGVHGRRFVEPLLGHRVGALVELHVPAKRWLVTVDPGYRTSLSDGSVRSLAVQGAELDTDERAAFEASPHHRDAVRLRRADEAAKVPGRRVPPLSHWRPIVECAVESVVMATRSGDRF